MTNDCKTCPVSTGTHKPAEAVHVQIDEPQDEAMRLADECDESATHWVHEIDTRFKAAKMLRAQHARIEDLEAQHREELRAYEITVANREARIAELESQLEAIGAGGVEPLRKPAAAPQAVQAAVPLFWVRLLRDGLYEGPVHNNSVGGKMLRDEKPGEWHPLYLHAATAHPAEGVPAQAVQQSVLKALLNAEAALEVAISRILKADPGHSISVTSEAKALVAVRAALDAATQPAAQGMDAEIQQAVEAERERICAAIKAEDDHCVDQGDYMLDSNDCIKIVRGKWVRPDYSVEAAQAKQVAQP